MSHADAWSSLPLSVWRATCATLHRWTQIAAKIRLARMPLINHSWRAALHETAPGLTTSAIPYGERLCELSFDFIRRALSP
jgi:hypothetical protein